MKKYFVFWMSGLVFSVVQAQDPCQVSIPSDAEAIFRSPLAEKTARNQAYWICNGAKVVFRSGNGLIFAERGTKVTVRYGTYTVYLKAGAELILGTRSETLVYYEGPLNVQRPAFNFQESYTNCPNLVFDYSQAPATDCAREEEPPLPENPVVEVPQTPYPPGPTPFDTPPASPEVSDFDTLPPPVPDDQHIIPPQVRVVPYGSPLITATARQQTYWVCPYAQLSHNGDNNVFYVEEGASLSLQGSQNIVYIKANTRLSLGYGSGNQVYYYDGVDLRQDNARDTRFMRLSAMQFDYSQAPPEACKP